MHDATDVPDTGEDLLTEAEVAARYRGKVSGGTLRNWRAQGRGPPYLKVGRAVLYPRDQLLDWERRQARREDG